MFTSFYPFLRVSGLTSVYPFWSADSYWHKKIPIGAKIHPNSAQMIAWLKGVPEHHNGHPYINYASWTQALYDAYASTPKYTIYESGHNKYWYNVPIPNGATSPTDSDSSVGIIDWNNRIYYSLWRLQKDPTTGKWSCGSAGAWSLDGTGLTPDGTWNTGASSMGFLGHVIRPEEIEAGVINHPLACGLKWPKATRVYPPAASRDARGSTDPYAIPFGARIQLDPSINLDSLGLSRTAKIIAKAMQKYGIVVKEMAGSFCIYAEHDITANWGADMNQAYSDIFNKLPADWRVIDYSVFGAVEK